MPFYDFPESPTYEIVGEVLRKTSKGEKVYSMAIGEPSYDTPREISEAAFESMKEGMTHYTSSIGIPEVRAAVVRKVKRKNGIICQEKNTIFISSKLAIYGILVALTKMAVNASMDSSVDAALDTEALAFSLLNGQKEIKEKIRKFLEK